MPKNNDNLKSIISSNSNSLERRARARSEMLQLAGIGMFRSLLRSPYVRRGVTPKGFVGHAAIDVMVILSDSDDEPRSQWRDLKRRLAKRRPELWENVPQLKLPSWADNKRYAVDVLDASDLVAVIYAMDTPIAHQLQDEIGHLFRKYDSADIPQILSELEREIGWAGTMIRLDMKSIYEPGDYDDPVQPPGQPKN